MGAECVHTTQDWEEGDGKYVAPELLNGLVEPTPAADIYSLGATLYECATGELAALWRLIQHSLSISLCQSVTELLAC